MGWTDARVETLKKLWLEGLSASQIQKHLGGVTRNAVLGKVHRLGLSGRAAPSQPARPVFSRPRAPRKVATRLAGEDPVAANEKPIAPIALPEEPGSATILTLGAHMCKWPIGDPESADFTFCGRSNRGDGPYCTEHARVAYQPQQKKGKATATELARSVRRYM